MGIHFDGRQIFEGSIDYGFIGHPLERFSQPVEISRWYMMKKKGLYQPVVFSRCGSHGDRND